MAKSIDWQTPEEDESFTIPAGHYVNGVDLDADEPYCTVSPYNASVDEPKIKIPIPKALAYYMTTHWCGSKKVHDGIQEHARRTLQSELKKCLGL